MNRFFDGEKVRLEAAEVFANGIWMQHVQAKAGAYRCAAARNACIERILDGLAHERVDEILALEEFVVDRINEFRTLPAAQPLRLWFVQCSQL